MVIWATLLEEVFDHATPYEVLKIAGRCSLSKFRIYQFDYYEATKRQQELIDKL